MPLHTYDPRDDEIMDDGPDLADLYESDAAELPALSLEQWLNDAWWEDLDAAAVDGEEELAACELIDPPF